MSVDGGKAVNTRRAGSNLPPVTGEGPVYTAPVFEPDVYREDMAGLGLCRDQETEILEILWSIMGHFARWGFNADVCGLMFQDFNQASANGSRNDRLSHSNRTDTLSDGSGKERRT